MPYGYPHTHRIGRIEPNLPSLYDFSLFEIYLLNGNDYLVVQIDLSIEKFFKIFITFIMEDTNYKTFENKHEILFAFLENPLEYSKDIKVEPHLSGYISQSISDWFFGKKGFALENVDISKLPSKKKKIIERWNTTIKSIKNSAIVDLHDKLGDFFEDLALQNIKIALNKSVDDMAMPITAKDANMYKLNRNYMSFAEVYQQAKEMSKSDEKPLHLSLRILELLHQDYLEYLRSFVEITLKKNLDIDLITSPYFNGLLIHRQSNHVF